MTVKVVWQFKEGDTGWSETYYHTADLPPLYLGNNLNNPFAAGSPALAFAQQRSALLNVNSEIIRCRVSVLGSPRQFISADIPGNLPLPTFAGPAIGQRPSLGFISLLCNVTNGTAHRKKLYLGGLPQAIMSLGDSYTPNGLWDGAFANFNALLSAGNYRIVSRPDQTAFPLNPITSFLVQPDGRTAYVIPTLQPAPNVNSWYVIVRSMNPPRGWNGVHRCIPNPSAPTAMILGPTRKPGVSSPPWTVASGGTVQLATTPVLSGVAAIIAERLVERKRGRPFASPRGRR